MPNSIHFTITLNQKDSTLKVQATCEGLTFGDVSYFMDEIKDALKSDEVMQEMTRTNAGYIEQTINLLK